MRKLYLCVVLTAVAAFPFAAAYGQRVEVNTYPSANVMDYGAKGDGHTDDTAAIKKAFKAIYPRRGAGKLPWMTEIVFPAGHYVISDAITEFSGMQVVRGEGYAKIRQTNPDKDIFRNTYAWQITISGLSFEGGRNQIYMQNGNMDTGQIFIEKCKFLNASGAAIYADVLSTTVTIANCRIMQCEQAWILKRSDQSVMKDTWITSSMKMKNKAVIENRGGWMSLENICGVPLVNGADQRWIDNYGMLLCRKFRFGGEGGGFTPVVNFAKPHKDGFGVTVVLDNCILMNEGNAKRKCAVYLEEIPNLLVIKDSTITTPALIVDPKIDLKTYFAGVKPGMVKVALRDNVGEFIGEVPELLKNPLYPKAPPVPTLSEADTKKALEKARKKVLSLPDEKRKPAESNGHTEQTDPSKYKIINAKDYVWDLTDRMDAISDPNADYIAAGAAGDGVILLRRRNAEDSKWPHVLVKDVTIDLDKTPWLCFKLRDLGEPTAASTACRVVDKKSGTAILLGEWVYEGSFYNYRAFNLKKLFGTGGTRTFDIKFYYLGSSYNHPHQPQIGDWIYLEFIRAEEE